MNKALMNVVPFILQDESRTLKNNHKYTVEEVSLIDLKELTEIALLIPSFLQPEGWRFVYSFSEGDVVTRAARPTTFLAPSADVIQAIKQRVETEGYQMFVTVRQHFLFLQWDNDFVGCLSEESFNNNIKKGIPCYNCQSEIFWTPDMGLCKEEFCFEIYDTKLVPLA